MWTRQITVVLIFSVLAMVCTASGRDGGGAMTGGYKPIKDLNDPYVQGVAKFAVDEHNKNSGSASDPHLELVKIVKGESQVVAGTNYRLNLVTNDTHQYLAQVYDKPWAHYRSLVLFTQLNV